MAKDSGNTFAKAKLLNLTQRSSFVARLDKLKANANLLLLGSNSQRIGQSAQSGIKPENITATLDAGQYVLKVTGTKQSTRYRLRLTQTPDLSPTPIPTPTPGSTPTPTPNTAPVLSTNTGVTIWAKCSLVWI